MVKKLIIGALVVIALLVVAVPYIRVEVLTAMHGEEFEDEYRQTSMITDIEYFKVFSYSSSSAKVYYVIADHMAADMITFVKRDGKWVMNVWETIWAKMGSADDLIWPYYG